MATARLESAYTERMRQTLKGIGKSSYKMSSVMVRGMPDTYLASGIWIESKVIAVPKRLSIKNTPITNFSETQRFVMDKLISEGDHVFVAILWLVDDDTVRSMFMPWRAFRHILKWDIGTVFHFSAPYSGGSVPQVPEFWENKKVSLSIFEARFKAWEFAELPRHFDTTTTSDYWLYKNGKLVGGENNPTHIKIKEPA